MFMRNSRNATQATTVMPATRNSKDDSDIMTAHNSRNASNSRNESNNRTANPIWTPAKAGMLTKVVKLATACRKTNYSRDTVKIKDDSSSRDSRNIMDVISNRTSRTDNRMSATVEKTATFSKDTSNRSTNSQLEH
jgi:hypothetical protein